MARVEYIGKQPYHSGRGFSRGLVWHGPGDIVECADDIAEKLVRFHPDIYRLVPETRTGAGAPVPVPTELAAELSDHLITSYMIQEAGVEKPAYAVSVLTLRHHLSREFGVRLERKHMRRTDLLHLLKEHLEAGQHAEKITRMSKFEDTA